MIYNVVVVVRRYGYARMTIYNGTTMLWEQIQTDNECELLAINQQGRCGVYTCDTRLWHSFSLHFARADPATTGTVIDAMLLITQH